MTENIRRIHVTANAGSGKSTVAVQLGKLTGLPVYGLDKIVWQPRWILTPREERFRLETAIAKKPEWIVDGVSNVFRDAADLIIFLNHPRRTCLWRCMKRNAPYLFRSRPGLPERCPEILIMSRLLKIIWQFPTVMRPKILGEFKHWKNERKLLHVQSNRDLEAALKIVKSSIPAH